MNDQERARVLLRRWFAATEPSNLVDRVAEAFAAVRRDERARVVAWLRRRAAVPMAAGRTGDVGSVYAATVEGEAARIEAGEHATDAAGARAEGEA